MHPASIGCLGSSHCTEDQQTLLTSLVQRHEHVRSALLFHSSQLTATIASYPTFTVLGNVHLSAIVSLVDVGDSNTASTLLQKPRDELPAATPLLQRARHEGHLSDVLQDATRRAS